MRNNILNEAKSKDRYEIDIFDEYERGSLYSKTVSSLESGVKFIEQKAMVLMNKRGLYKGEPIALNSKYVTIWKHTSDVEYYANIKKSLTSFVEMNDETGKAEPVDVLVMAKEINDELEADHEYKISKGFYNESMRRNNGMSLQKRFERVERSNAQKDILASLIVNADAIDKNLARILGVKSDAFVIDPHKKSGLIISDMKFADKHLVIKVSPSGDGIAIVGALKDGNQVTRNLPADSSVKKIAGMIATIIYEVENRPSETPQS